VGNYVNRIVARTHGRVGNDMFRYAFLRLFAEKRGLEWNYLDLKGHLKELYPTLTMGTGPSSKHVDWHFVEDSSEADSLLSSGKRFWTGNFQDSHALETIHSEASRVKGWFTQEPEVVRLAKQFWDERVGTCCVNVRGREFVTRGLAVQGEWYRKAMELVRGELGSDIKFEAVTDDPEHAHDIVGSGIPAQHVSPASDFALLTFAPAIIQSNSTFCWWASYLNHGRPVFSPDLRGKMWNPWLWGVSRLGWRVVKS
jgi:hypothetical protein